MVPEVKLAGRFPYVALSWFAASPAVHWSPFETVPLVRITRKAVGDPEPDGRRELDPKEMFSRYVPATGSNQVPGVPTTRSPALNTPSPFVSLYTATPLVESPA